VKSKKWEVKREGHLAVGGIAACFYFLFLSFNAFVPLVRFYCPPAFRIAAIAQLHAPEKDF